MYTKVKKAITCIHSYKLHAILFFSVTKLTVLQYTFLIFSLKILQIHFWPLSGHHSIPLVLNFLPHVLGT